MHLISSIILAGFTTASVIPNGESHTAAVSRPVKRDNPVWPWGVIGDSWGSGVSYNDSVLLDDNLDNCLRTWEGHGPQMNKDSSWQGSFSSGLRDAACSGSELVDLAKGRYQLGKVGLPNLLVMTSGGNDVGFANVLENCIYQPNVVYNYGPAFADDKDKTHACAVAIQDSKDNIANRLEKWLTDTINDILADPNVNKNPDFLLYLTGYARFFGTDYADWCNTYSFNLPNIISPIPFLSKELRTEMNAVVSSVNDLYKKVQQQYSKQVRFIDIDSGFQGHRFCETGMSPADQYDKNTQGDKVYLWNLNFYVSYDADADDTAYQTGKMTTQRASQLMSGNNNVTAWSGTGSGGEVNQPSNGWRLRPFHPKFSGYTTIKNAILAQMKSDGLPKAAVVTTSSPSPSQTPTNNCSYVDNAAYLSYTLNLIDDKSIDTSCGGGFLDNLRGRCGQGITAWGCNYVGDTGATMSWNVPETCSVNDVQDAINAASQGQDLKLTCNGQPAPLPS